MVSKGFPCQTCSWSSANGKISFPALVRASEFGLTSGETGSTVFSRASLRYSKHPAGRTCPNRLLAGAPFLFPLFATTYVYCTVNRHRVIPEFIWSHIVTHVIPMDGVYRTAESPPAQAQQSAVSSSQVNVKVARVKGAYCLFRVMCASQSPRPLLIN